MPTMLLVVGVVFGPIAAAMAFAITYEEWSHHGLSPPELIKRSLHMALVTLAFFVVLSVAVGVLMSFAFGPQ